MEAVFFINDTATTEIYTLSLHDALPISRAGSERRARAGPGFGPAAAGDPLRGRGPLPLPGVDRGRPAGNHLRRSPGRDRKSTRLNSSHANISYAVFCLKKQTIHTAKQPE